MVSDSLVCFHSSTPTFCRQARKADRQSREAGRESCSLGSPTLEEGKGC